jgi:hypothetical protein
MIPFFWSDSISIGIRFFSAFPAFDVYESDKTQPLQNAFGTGVADDKLKYAYVPNI